MARAGLDQKCVEIIGDLDHRSVRVLGQGEIDHQPGHPTVMGDQAPGDVDCVQRDRFNSGQPGFFE